MALSRVIPEEKFTTRILDVLRNDAYLVNLFGQNVAVHISEWFPETGDKGVYPRIQLNNLNWSDNGTYTHWGFDGTIDFNIFSYGDDSYDRARDMANRLDILTQDRLSNDEMCFVFFNVSSGSTQISSDGLTAVINVTYSFRVTGGT